MKNLQRGAIFESDQPVEEQLVNAFKQIGEKPSKLFKMFWSIWLQLCLAIFILIVSVLLPIWIIYG